LEKKKDIEETAEDAAVVADTARLAPASPENHAGHTSPAKNSAKNAGSSGTDDYEFADLTADVPQEVPEVIEQVPATSLAARVLQALAMIVVGISLALWGAPKIAPLLPAGLSQVARFLMPGQTEAKAEVEALRAEMGEKLAALPQQQPAGVDQAAIDRAIGIYDANLSKQLAEIRDQLAAPYSHDIEARIAGLETRMEGVSAELAAVSDRLSRQSTENGGALSEKAGARLSGYQAALEDLRTEVAELAAKNDALSRQAEDIAITTRHRMEEAEIKAANFMVMIEIRKLLTEIGNALSDGTPFQAALAGLEEMTGTSAPAALAAVAETGTPSWETLRNQYADQAHAALRADANANAGDGMGGKLNAFLRSQISTRSLERRDGNDVDAILSRVEDDLANRRLDAALSEIAALPEAAKTPMQDWIAALKALNGAQNALNVLAGWQSPTE